MSELNKDKYRLFIIDDHSVVRHGLVALLGAETDMTICGQAASAAEALTELPKCQPDIVLVDITLPDKNGLELIREMRATGITAKILVLSMHDELAYAERALRAGAQGYVMKENADEVLIEAIHTVGTGQPFVSEKVSSHLLQQQIGGSDAGDTPGVASLTDRELEVFEALGQGLSTKKIASILDLSARTVEVHRAHIKRKLKCEDAAQVLREAVRWAEGHHSGRT